MTGVMGMLILRRKKNESILIGDDIRITITDCASSGVRIAIEAPKQVSVVREELFEAERMNKASLAPEKSSVRSLQDALRQHLLNHVTY